MNVGEQLTANEVWIRWNGDANVVTYKGLVARARRWDGDVGEAAKLIPWLADALEVIEENRDGALTDFFRTTDRLREVEAKWQAVKDLMGEDDES